MLVRQRSDDCLHAAVCSAHALPYRQLPDNGCPWDAVRERVALRGKSLVWRPVEPCWIESVQPSDPHAVAVVDLGGDRRHAVVVDVTGRVMHDPRGNLADAYWCLGLAAVLPVAGKSSPCPWCP